MFAFELSWYCRNSFRMNAPWLEGFGWFLRHLVSNWKIQLQTHTF